MWRVSWLLTLVLGVAGACSNNDNNTKIVLRVWSDFTVPTEMNIIRVAVKGPTDSRSVPFQLAASPQVGKSTLPVVVVLVPPDNKNLAFDVAAVGYLGSDSNPIVSQAARLSFLRGESRVLTLFLGRSCPSSIVCDGDHTCAGGRCDQPIAVDPSTLPFYDPNTVLVPPDAGAVAGLDGGWDVRAAEAGRMDTSGRDVGGDGREVGDGVPDRPADFYDSSPDSRVDLRDGNFSDLGAGGRDGFGGSTGSTGGAGGGEVDGGVDAAGGTGDTGFGGGGAKGGDGAGGAAGSGGGGMGGAGSGGIATGGATVADAAADVPVPPIDAARDVPVVLCGGAGQACCAGSTCTAGGCCVGAQCVADGTACSTSSTCASGVCASAALLTASTLSLGFGPIVLSQSSGVTSFTISNTGQMASGVMALNSSSADFVIQSPIAGDCKAGVTALLPGASCTVRIVFTPSSAGARSGQFSFSATPGGSGSVSASGAGITPGSLASSLASVPFGTVAIGASSSPGSFTITNTGQQPSGGITVGSSSPIFAIQTGVAGDCAPGATLGGNASCTVHIVFKPTAVGSYSETITFSASPGGSGSVGVTGTGALPRCTLGSTKVGSCKLGSL